MSTNYDAHTGASHDRTTLRNIVTGETLTLEALQGRNQELPKAPGDFAAAVAPAVGELVMTVDAQAPAVAGLVAVHAA